MGFKIFNESAYKIVDEWLIKNSNLVADKKEFAKAVEEFLVKEKFILPTSSQLMCKIFKLYNQKQSLTFNMIASNLTLCQKKFIDDICKGDNKDNESYKLITEIKKPIAEANVKNITCKIVSLNKVKHLKFEKLQLAALGSGYVEKLSKLIYHYDRSSIRKIKPDAKIYTMVACYIHEITKSAIDEIIVANDKLLGEIERRVNRDFDEHYKKLKNKAQTSRDFALETLKGLQSHEQRDSMTIGTIL